MVAIGVVAAFLLQSPQAGIIGQHALKVGDKVYLAGGMNGHDTMQTTWAFITGARTWEPKSVWRNSRSFGVAATYGGKMYVFGGIEANGNHSNQIDAYDPVTDKWSMVGVMPETMTRAAGAVWRGKLYLSGGYNGVADRKFAMNSARLWEYEFGSRTWKSLKSMAFPRHGHSLVPFQDRLWSVGGFVYIEGSERSVESYDPITNTWRNEHPLNQERGFVASAVVQGKLVTFGRVYQATHPAEYTPTGWKDRSSPDLPIRRFAFVQDGDSFLIFGGEEKGGSYQRYKP